MYTPCPMLVFRNVNGMKQLVAFGSMIGADADRTIVKRIILTGFPVRVRKRWASVKYMFSDPEDVKWFQPAGLTTKHGLNGKIEQSIGEHGTMKCLFNAPIKQHDTVCLCLYKRVYPKFVEDCNPGDEEDGTCEPWSVSSLLWPPAGGGYGLELVIGVPLHICTNTLRVCGKLSPRLQQGAVWTCRKRCAKQKGARHRLGYPRRP